MAEIAGDAMGFVLQSDGVKTLYVVGDTIWMSYVDAALETYKPEAKIIAVHMDAVNHTMTSSDEVREFVKAHSLNDRVYVPREGETLKF